MKALAANRSFSVEDRIKWLITDRFGVGEIKINPESDFIKDFGADSLDMFEFMISLEKEFDISIPDEDIGKTKTVGEVLAYLKGKIASFSK